MLQIIFDFHQDKDKNWVAELACQHFQHVRHKPTCAKSLIIERGEFQALHTRCAAQK